MPFPSLARAPPGRPPPLASPVAFDPGDVSDADSFVTEYSSDEAADAPAGVGDGTPTRARSQKLESRYVFVKKVGEGATATAFLCLDVADGSRAVILKKCARAKFRALPRPGAPAPRAVAHEAEIAVLKKLSSAHPNIIDLLGVVDDPASPTVALVLEYANGGDLKRRVAADALVDDGHPGVRPETLWDWARDLVNGLAYMHKHGVMHRDVKPENVLLCNRGRGGEGHTAKLADFGASRIVDADRLHLDLAADESDDGNETDHLDDPSGAVDRCVDQAGSPAFMSPECASGDPYRGFPSDVWSLGMTMYYCLFARSAFARDNPAATMDAIADPNARVPYDDPFYADDARCPPELRAFLARCLERDPERRADVRDLLGDAWLTRGGESPLTSWSFLLRVRCDASDRALAVDRVGHAKEEEGAAAVATVRLLGDGSSSPASAPTSVIDRAFAAAGAAERRPREFAPGEALVTQGAPADAAYLVLEGAAEVILERRATTESGEEMMARASSRAVGAGEFVGEVAMLHGEGTYGASVVATEPTVVLVVRKEEFAAALAAGSEEDRARVERVASRRRALRREMSVKLRAELGAKLALFVRDEDDDEREDRGECERATPRDGETAIAPAAIAPAAIAPAAIAPAAIAPAAIAPASPSTCRTAAALAAMPMLPETAAREVRSWRCAAGTIIAARGEVATAAYFLKSGAARETLALDDETPLATFAAGDFLGYSSIALRRGRRLSTFVATRACELLVVPREAFVDLVAATPGLSERMVAHGERVHAELREKIAARLGRGVRKIISARRLAAAAGTASEGTGRQREDGGEDRRDDEDAKGAGMSRFARETS
jgi:serine/threonine protein kinase/CRP-like cAMP-binding protein